MKKIIYIALLNSILCLTSCNKDTSSDKEQTDILTFTSTKVDTVGNDDSSITCVFKSDKTVLFSYEETSSYNWNEKNGYGYELAKENEVIYVDYYKNAATFYFYHEYNDSLYVFIAKDTGYRDSLASDYTPSYKRKSSAVFEGIGSTSGNKTIAKLHLYDDAPRNYIFFTHGIDSTPYESNYVAKGSGWSFENSTYSITINGNKYSSSYCDSEGKKGYRIKLNETSSYYYVTSESFDWQDYTDSDFE